MSLPREGRTRVLQESKSQDFTQPRGLANPSGSRLRLMDDHVGGCAACGDSRRRIERTAKISKLKRRTDSVHADLPAPAGLGNNVNCAWIRHTIGA